MLYFRIIITLRSGEKKQGVREFPPDTSQQNAYFEVWRKTVTIYKEPRIDSIKVEPLSNDHPHVLHYLAAKHDPE